MNAYQSRVLRTSYFWLFAVPILVNWLSAAEKLQLAVLDKPIPLTLPFHWWLFYFGAVAFAIATFVYSWRCPAFVKRFPTWSIFLQESDSGGHLLSEAAKLFDEEGVDSEQAKRLAADFAKDYTKSPYSMPGAVRPSEIDLDELVGMEMLPQRKTDAFYKILQRKDRLYPVSRAVCTLFFAIGFIFSGWVLIQNFWFVLKYLWRGHSG